MPLGEVLSSLGQNRKPDVLGHFVHGLHEVETGSENHLSTLFETVFFIAPHPFGISDFLRVGLYFALDLRLPDYFAGGRGQHAGSVHALRKGSGDDTQSLLIAASTRLLELRANAGECCFARGGPGVGHSPVPDVMHLRPAASAVSVRLRSSTKSKTER